MFPSYSLRSPQPCWAVRAHVRCGAILSAVLLVLSFIQSPATAIYAGVSALGSPFVVKIHTSQHSCSGALVDDQVVATAAHCVVTDGIPIPASEFKVFAPGVRVTSRAPYGGVLAIFYPKGFLNSTNKIEPNDIAFLALDRALGVARIDALASYEMTRDIIASGAAITTFGYGTFSELEPASFTSRPIAQKRYSGFSGYERTYLNFANDTTGSTCPGDSGGPSLSTFREKVYLLGVHSGGSGPCSATPASTGSAVATIAGEYPALLAEARAYLAATVPSAPRDFVVTREGSEGVGDWLAPLDPRKLVTGYVLVDGQGRELCRTSGLSCRFSLGLGRNTLSLHALAGSVRSPAVALDIEVRVPAPEAIVLVNSGLAGRLSWTPPKGFEPFIIGYLVTDGEGRQICRSLSPGCEASLTLGDNRFTIAALTANGAGEVGQATFALRNAATPTDLFLQTTSQGARVIWNPSADSGNANPDSITVEIRDIQAGLLLCTAPVKSGSCSFPLSSADFAVHANVHSDLGPSQPVFIDRYSGASALGLIEQTTRLATAGNRVISKLLRTDPGYSADLLRLRDQLPVLDNDFVFSDVAHLELVRLTNALAVLQTKIALNPKLVSVICVKGGQRKKVTARAPKCPTGYRPQLLAPTG